MMQRHAAGTLDGLAVGDDGRGRLEEEEGLRGDGVVELGGVGGKVAAEGGWRVGVEPRAGRLRSSQDEEGSRSVDKRGAKGGLDEEQSELAI